MDNKTNLAQLIVIQLEAIQGSKEATNTLTLVNEVLRDAKQLAEETLKETG